MTNPVSDTADQVVNGPTARSTYGVTGAGIKIGIISTSFDELNGVGGHAAADEQSGALPAAGSVHILQDGFGGVAATDEGRAMAELVHTVAPDAQIYFYTAGTSVTDEAKAVAALQAAGCQVICDDYNYLEEPFYQMGGPISSAIDMAVNAGVTYFTMAYNAAASYYENSFKPITATVLTGITATAHNFGTTANPNAFESITIPANASVRISLQWDQPFQSFGGKADGTGPGAANSLGFYLLDANTHALVASRNVSMVGSDPVVWLNDFQNGGATQFLLAVIQDGGTTAPGLFKIIVSDNSNNPVVFNDSLAGTGSGSAFGHALDTNAITVGAAPENNPTTTETMSSTGPGEFLFDANGNRLTTPVSAEKVDVTAPDGNTTTVSNLNPFFGTSAAVAIAAGVGALVLQANPMLNPSDVSNLLQDSATAIGAATVAGAGLIDAAVASGLAKTLTFTETASNATLLGTHLADTFVAAAGVHTIDGSGGGDTVILHGARSSYTIATNGDGSATLTDLTTGRDGSNHIANIVDLQFADKAVFIANADQANIARLYSAAFDRLPDIAGLVGWENIYTANVSASAKANGVYVALAETPAGFGGSLSVAAGFTNSTEFQQANGSLDDTAFVTKLYTNILGRMPETQGINDWLNLMHNGDANGLHYTREMVLVGISEGSENIAKTSDWLFST